jgi:pyrrolidone-carboxylate peptidase
MSVSEGRRMRGRTTICASYVAEDVNEATLRDRDEKKGSGPSTCHDGFDALLDNLPPYLAWSRQCPCQE